MVVDTPREPLLVHIDSDLMRQALLNLVLNAMQAMPDGGVVRVTLRREQHLAVVEVADKGVGIPPSCFHASSSCTLRPRSPAAVSGWL